MCICVYAHMSVCMPVCVCLYIIPCAKYNNGIYYSFKKMVKKKKQKYIIMTNNMAYLGTYSVMGPRQKAFLVLKSRFTKNLVTFKTFFFFFLLFFLALQVLISRIQNCSFSVCESLFLNVAPSEWFGVMLTWERESVEYWMGMEGYYSETWVMG